MWLEGGNSTWGEVSLRQKINHVQNWGDAESTSLWEEQVCFLGAAWLEELWLANTAASCDVCPSWNGQMRLTPKKRETSFSSLWTKEVMLNTPSLKSVATQSMWYVPSHVWWSTVDGFVYAKDGVLHCLHTGRHQTWRILKLSVSALPHS